MTLEAPSGTTKYFRHLVVVIDVRFSCCPEWKYVTNLVNASRKVDFVEIYFACLVLYNKWQIGWIAIRIFSLKSDDADDNIEPRQDDLRCGIALKAHNAAAAELANRSPPPL